MKSFFIIAVLLLACATSAPHAQDTRPIWLSPIEGTGVEGDHLRSRCLRMAGKGNIDLRPWGVNRFLCASSSLPADMTGVQQLGDSLLSNLTPARKAALEALIGRPLAGLTVREVIVEILQSRLQPGRDGKLKIYLGRGEPIYQQTAGIPFPDNGLFADVSIGTAAVATVAAAAIMRVPTKVLAALVAVVLSFTHESAYATTLATETFTATNGNLDGCQANGCTHTWTEFSGTAWTVASNQADASGSATAIARMDSALATVDHEASATFVAVATGGSGTNTTCSILARKENNATATFYRTIVTRRNSGELKETELAVTSGGSTTSLDTDTTDWADSDVHAISADGSSIIGKRNGVETLSSTDGTISTGTYTGLRYFSDSASGDCIVDNLNAADISSVIGALRRRSF